CVRCFWPQDGQSSSLASAERRSSFSNLVPQSSHLYSKIGIDVYPHIVGQAFLPVHCVLSHYSRPRNAIPQYIREAGTSAGCRISRHPFPVGSTFPGFSRPSGSNSSLKSRIIPRVSLENKRSII